MYSTILLQFLLFSVQSVVTYELLSNWNWWVEKNKGIKPLYKDRAQAPL
jgi:hypothetical protein